MLYIVKEMGRKIVLIREASRDVARRREERTDQEVSHEGAILIG
jgi:hypothetical protein